MTGFSGRAAVGLACPFALVCGCQWIAGMTDSQLAPAQPGAGPDASFDQASELPFGNDALLEASVGEGDGADADTGLEVGLDGAEAGDAQDGCGDTVASAANCGRCGHDCLGGDCKAGVCQPVLLLDGLGSPKSIAVDSTSVYLTDQDNQRVYKASKTDGAGVTILADEPATLLPFGIAIDETGVYWTNQHSPWGSVRKCPLGGCGGSAAVSIAQSADEPYWVLVRGNEVYWTEQTGGRIRKADRTGAGSPSTVWTEPGIGEPHGLAAYGDDLYFTDKRSARVSRISLAGGSAVVLVDDAGYRGHGVAAGPTGLYWATEGIGVSDGNLWRLAPESMTAGGVAQSLASSQVEPFAVALDATRVYWVSQGLPDKATGTVMACDLPACAGGPVTLAQGLVHSLGIALDDAAVYWVEEGLGGVGEGSAKKVAKP